MLAEIGPARNLLRLLWAKATVAVMQQFNSYRGQTGHAADIVNVSSLTQTGNQSSRHVKENAPALMLPATLLFAGPPPYECEAQTQDATH